MDDGSALLKLLFVLTFPVNLSSPGTHTLHFSFTTISTGKYFPPVGFVDGEQIVYYNITTRSLIPKTEWMMKIKANDPDNWERKSRRMEQQLELFKNIMDTLMSSFNHEEGVHTLQRMFGCQLDDHTRGYDQYAYDGEDFISLNLTNATWTANNSLAERFINDWDPDQRKARYWKDFLEKDCIDWLHQYMNSGKGTLERKVRPEVFHKHCPSPEVVCHATGFFPKALNITWQKDGEDVHEDVVEFRETLPNQDGSFQKRIILNVTAEELQKHNYTCVVQHSSLEKELVLSVSKCRILKGAGGSIVAIVAILMIVIGIIIVGIVVWKKKNSGIKPVAQKVTYALGDNLLPTSAELRERDENREMWTDSVNIILPVQD